MTQTYEPRSVVERSVASPQTFDVQSAFEQMLREQDLFAALRYLNGTTSYRFTGIYSFEPGVVRNVALFDRENPNLETGDDVPWFDSYCMMTANNGSECQIQNSLIDDRLVGHAARQKVLSYCAVLLRTPAREELGTLCHYDVRAIPSDPEIVRVLHACRPSVERRVWQHLQERQPMMVPPRSGSINP